VNIAHVTAEDPDQIGWFLDRGMPDSSAFDLPASGIIRYGPLLDDDEFRAWAETDGPGVYARFLVTERPGYLLEGVAHLWRPGGFDDQTLLDFPKNITIHRPG